MFTSEVMMKNLMKWATENGVNFKVNTVNDTIFVYFHGQSEQIYDEIEGKYFEYVPYLRVSYHESEGSYYVRDNGYCSNVEDDELKEEILRNYRGL